jgi:hypothetical protein
MSNNNGINKAERVGDSWTAGPVVPAGREGNYTWSPDSGTQSPDNGARPPAGGTLPPVTPIPASETDELLGRVLARLDEIAYTQGQMAQTVTKLAAQCWYCPSSLGQRTRGDRQDQEEAR